MATLFTLPFADVGQGIVPSDGAKLYFYAFGTSTPKDTYTTSALSTANSNPVEADADGLFPAIWLSGMYSATLKDKNGVQIWYAPEVLEDTAYSIEYVPPQTGGIVRTVNSKLSDFVSVKDFGAVGDGVADDTDSINAALLSGASSVYFPAGTYLVSAASDIYASPVLSVPSSVCIVGSGSDSAIIKLAAHTTGAHRIFAFNSVSDSSICGVTIDGNSSQQTGVGDEQSHCIFLYDAENISISDCILIRAKGDGVYSGGASASGTKNVSISNCFIWTNYRQGISLVKGSEIRIVSNDIYGTTGSAPGAGIDIEANTLGDTLNDIVISNNTIRSNQWGVYVNSAAPSSYITIANNVFSDQRAADVICNGTHIVISSNIITLNGKTANYAGIELYNCSDITVTGNSITGSYDPDERGGVRLSRGANRVTIVSNIVCNTFDAGIKLYTSTTSGTGDSNDIVVSGNVLSDCNVAGSTIGAITVGSHSSGTPGLFNINITGNQIADSRSGGNEPDFGIAIINPTTDNLKTWNIADNLIHGPTSQISNISGWSFLAHSHSHSASLNFDLTAVASQDLTIGAPGAVLGDSVSLGVPNGSVTADTLFYAWVSATDIVTVRAMRIAGTPNPANGTFVVTVNSMLTH